MSVNIILQNELVNRLVNIQDVARRIDAGDDSITIDTQLGILEALVHEARLCIDEEWRQLREEAFKHKPQTLKDLI